MKVKYFIEELKLCDPEQELMKVLNVQGIRRREDFLNLLFIAALTKGEKFEYRNNTSCKVKEYTVNHCGTTFYISECPECGCKLDSNQMQKYCHECGQRLEWGE